MEKPGVVTREMEELELVKRGESGVVSMNILDENLVKTGGV